MIVSMIINYLTIQITLTIFTSINIDVLASTVNHNNKFLNNKPNNRNNLHQYTKNDSFPLDNRERSPRWFPFYTIGRFPNDVCNGRNNLMGTCLVRGECRDNGGIFAGSCSNITTQAVCCTYQMSCGATTQYNNTYFYNIGYPGTYSGSGRCSIIVEPTDVNICQLRIDFLTLALAPPNGHGYCTTDSLQITGGSSTVPPLCGENSGLHVYVNFNGRAPITISVITMSSYTFNRQWQFKISQLSCASPTLAPSGCLQYYFESSGKVHSFNYASTPNPRLNSIGLAGTRQLANQRYGICIRKAANMCSITWKQIDSDPFSLTITGDVDVYPADMLGSDITENQNCTTDYIIIPNPERNNVALSSDRFCGLGMMPVISFISPFVLYVVTDGNEDEDISNRGFSLEYEQNDCPII